MGGRSDGRLKITDNKTMEFNGTLSLENNGGFASMRTRASTLGLKKNDTLVARVRGDGREYAFNLYTPNRSTAFSYRAPFGADRIALLNQIDSISYTISTTSGFGMMRSGRRASYLGPVTASTTACAAQIISSLLEQNVGPVFWDIPGPNVAAQAIAKQLGFIPVRALTRMTLGQMPTAPNMMAQFAITSSETG